MRIFQTSTLRYKDFDELIVDEQGAFKKIDSIIYSVFVTPEEWAASSIEKYVRESIQNGIKVYSGLGQTGKLEILCDKIMNNTQYMIEFVAPMDKAELLEDLMRKFAADNRELLASAQE
jgi:hypothetical protein